MKRIEDKGYILLILIVTGVFFYCLNSFVPYYDDDLWYAFRYIPQETLSPLHDMADVLVSQYHHYLGENGRALVHIILQSLMGCLPDWAFDVLNTLVFLLFVLLIVRYTLSSRCCKEPLSYLLVVVAVFMLLPDRDYLFYWAAGALNYLWTSVAALLFLLLWRDLRQGGKVTSHYVPLWVLVSFLCAFTHEAIALPVGAVLLGWMLLHYRRIGNNRLTYCALAFGLGCAMLLFAPPAFVKAGRVATSVGSLDWVASVYKLQQLNAVSLLLLLLVVTSCFREGRVKVKNFIRDNSILCSITVVAFIFAVIVGLRILHFRPFYGVEFYALLLIMRYYDAILRPVMERYMRCSTIVVSLLVAGWMMVVFPAASRVGETHHKLFTDYENSTNGIVYLSPDTVSPIAAPWVMNLSEYYLALAEAPFWRSYVIPLHFMKNDTMQVPTPIMALDSIGRYKLYGAYSRVLPIDLRPVIESPSQFFIPAHKMPGDSPFYAAGREYMVTPLDSLSPNDSWLWEYYPVSWRDKAATMVGRLRRAIAPQSFSATGDVQWCDTILLPDGRSIVKVKLPDYRRVRAVVRK